jgi:RNA 3'-terminal phosphate cyclase (ATP)
VSLVALDGAMGEGGGQVLRAALALAAVTGRGFEIARIRARRPRPGLMPQHLATIRAVALACGAKVSGAFDGSPDLRFEPGPVVAGSFRFEIGTAGAVSLLMETVLPVLGTASARSRVEATGGTHVPWSPSFEYVSRHWTTALRGLGLAARLSLIRAGFYPPGGGEVVAHVEPWPRPGGLDLSERGPLLRLMGVSGAARLKGQVAERQRDAAARVLWEERRLEAEWQVLDVSADSPGSFLFLEAAFEKGRGAFGYLGRRGVRAESIGDGAARRLIRFLEDEEGAVDPHLADQLVVPLALAGGGGRVTTVEVTRHLETAVAVLGRFGFGAKVWGRRGGPGGVEIR